LRWDPRLAFRSWELYNRKLLALRDRHPERCFVAHAPAFAADLAGFLQRLATKLDLPLHGGDFHALYEPEELAPSCQPSRSTWEEMIPEALALYDRLEEIADLPSAGEPTVSRRQRSLLQGSEILLYKLLEANQGGGLETKHELVRLRDQQKGLHQELEAAEREMEVVAKEREAAAREVEVLREIERSRSFALVRAWWRLARRLGPAKS
jgi:hypothetical protein